METIFIVDDSDINLAKAKQTLEDHYRVLTLPSAIKMFALLEKVTPDLILLDIEMPEMDGFTALERLSKSELTAKIPVVFLTASTDATTEARGFEMGAIDFIIKPFSAPVLLNRIASHLHINDLIKKRTQRIESLQSGIISVLADMVENRDQTTGGHIERSTNHVKSLVDEMIKRKVYYEEMSGWDINTVISSSRLHDVGKISVSDLILNKPGKLTPEEFEIVKSHTTEGVRIIEQMIAQTGEESFLNHSKLFAGYHHERWDGAGYPYGLKGEDIPLQGRIMAIADVYDALVSKRPYKNPFTHDEAVKIIMSDSGKHFDAKIADLFFEIKDSFKDVN